ncbi:MAG: polynucleotide adenylyltransferase PcnB [Methylovulum sp.]|jgi:poly(A) polymerase
MITIIKKINIGAQPVLSFFKSVFQANLNETEATNTQNQHKIYPRSEHIVSRSQISDNALKVLYRLQKEGYEAYLVGGCVRDLLLGREPKDFDVVTNADPEQIRRVFRNCRIIGRRFRLAHVHFGKEVIEVATFRGAADEPNDKQVLNQEGRLLRDNVYGTIEEDVWRRDFTINALYYNIRDFSVIDYAQGMNDLMLGVLRLIGDPTTRLREDPVRMLRAIRFAVKLGFNIELTCEQAILATAPQLSNIPSARLYDEVIKLFLYGSGLQTFEKLRHYQLFQVLFPETERCLSTENKHFPQLLLIKALENSDNRIMDGKSVTAYFLFAAFLWEPVSQLATKKMAHNIAPYIAFQEAANEILAKQTKITALPRHITTAMREVWNLQPKFDARTGSKPSRLLTHPRFRAGFDFLVLRQSTGAVSQEMIDWWLNFQHADELEQRKMTQPQQRGSHKKFRKKPYRKKVIQSPSSSDTQ